MPLVRSPSFNLFIEILVRIALISSFCYMERCSPAWRPASSAELRHRLPRRESLVPAPALWGVVLSAPAALALLAATVCRDCNDAVEIILAWSLSLGINGVLTDMMKLIIGRPRPDFFYRCFPDGVESVDLQCTGDPLDIIEGRKSFPSGHSSLSFSSLCVASCWLAGRLRAAAPGAGSPRMLAALAPLVLALAIALSRSADHHHHWEDIVAGSLLGLCTGYLCYRHHYPALTSERCGQSHAVTLAQMSPQDKDDKWI